MERHSEWSDSFSQIDQFIVGRQAVPDNLSVEERCAAWQVLAQGSAKTSSQDIDTFLAREFCVIESCITQFCSAERANFDR